MTRSQYRVLLFVAPPRARSHHEMESLRVDATEFREAKNNSIVLNTYSIKI